ncbi:retention module-containing protein [Enterovibrio baiacu]|uniref:retention module-containing protein n=1 Tax=Enterovibrio baiacu TaxID=2491023 RepID=UPI00101220A7|nr:retention module-containing protein [Enterovibrio baiacu]MBE1275818.1 retention module-containing protein [Enterovibrio baiacu]
MIGHEFDSKLDVIEVRGQAFLVTNDARIIGLEKGMNIAPNQVLLTNNDSDVVVALDGNIFQIDSQCASCLVPAKAGQDASIATAQIQAYFNGEVLDSDLPLNLDVAQLQELILQGVDPTEVFEEAAAGEAAEGSSNAGFVVIEYLNASTLAEAGFDTTGPSSDTNIIPEFFGDDVNRNGDGNGDDGTTPPTEDIDAAGGQRVSLVVDEGDLDNSPYGTPTTATFTIEGGTEALNPGTLQIAPSALALFESELSTITSGGEAVTFTRSSTASGDVGTFTLVGTVNGEVVITLTLTATQDGNGLSISATLDQSAPLDHLSGSGTYININGDAITIDLPLQVADSSGDLLQEPAQVQLVSNDGAAPVVGTASVEIDEPQNNPVSERRESTTEGIDLGSDNIAKIEFDDTAAKLAFDGVTSHTQETWVDTSVDGVVTLRVVGTDEAVLEISLKVPSAPGETAAYEVTQFLPIDQDEDLVGDGNFEQSTFTLPFKVFDTDGDVSNDSEVTFTINDGVPTAGGERLDASGAPEDLLSIDETGSSQDTSDRNSATNSFDIEAASDKLMPDTLSIEDFSSLQTELMELQNNAGENVDEVTLVESTDANGNRVLTITASIGGEPALEFVFTATQASGSLDVTVETEFHQYTPLNHPQDPSAGLQSGDVTADDSVITIKIPVQIQDSDGNQLINPESTFDPSAPDHQGRVVTFEIKDNPTETIDETTVDAITVDESGIDESATSHQGSQASGTLNIDDTNTSGSPNNLNVHDGSGDTLADFNFEADYVTYPDGQPVLSGDFPVRMEQRPEGDTFPKTYYGIADDNSGDTRDVYKVVLASDGTFSFELLAGLDHAEGDGINTLTFNLTAFATDADGDVASKITVPITVTDDIPRTEGNLAIDIDDLDVGAISINVFEITDPSQNPGIEDLQGADSDTLITRIFNGEEWVDVSTRRESEIDIFSEADPSIQIGTVVIDPTTDPVGQITFTLTDEEFTGSIDQSLRYEVTDGDGDKVEGSISLIIDVDAAGGQKVSLTVNEGDLDDTTYSEASSSTFAIEAGTERLVPGSLQIAPSALALFESELATITAGGEPVVFTHSVEGDDVGTFTLVGKVGDEVVVTLTVVAEQDGNSLSVTATLDQTAPLDHTSGTGTYVNIDGDQLTINLPLQVEDTTGELMLAPAEITMVSNDGAPPSVDDVEIEIQEPQLNATDPVVSSTSDGVDLGSDEISKIEFDATAAESAFDGITSNGEETYVDTSVEGVLTLRVTGTDEAVLEISMKAPESSGDDVSYEVKQFLPFDQNEDVSGDGNFEQSTFNLPFTVFDADGDESNSAEVSITIKDGVPTTGGEQLDGSGNPVDILELNENVTTQDASESNSVTGSFDLVATTDKLVPDTLSIEDFASLQTELMGLQNNEGENVDGVTLVESVDGDGNRVLTVAASVGGETVLEFVFTATQAADSLDVTVETAFHQYAPLNHPQDPDAAQQEGDVTANGDVISIKIPVQILDTDGNSLINPDSTYDPSAPDTQGRIVTFEIKDDQLDTAEESTADTLTVNESSIDGSATSHQGSQASGNLNIDDTNDSGNPNNLDTNDGAGDTLKDFNFETDFVTYPDGQPVLSGDFPVRMEQRPEGDTFPKTYVGFADDNSGDARDVFTVVLESDGSFSFELLAGLDHAEGDGINTLSFNLTAFATDADGDVVSQITVPITVTDDVPRTEGNLAIEIGDLVGTPATVSLDVFEITDPSQNPGIEDLQGADSSTLITRLFNGIEWVDVSTRRDSEIEIYSETDNSIQIGTVEIDPRTDPVGQITFTSTDSNVIGSVDQNILFEVTDADGDVVEGSIALTIEDQTPTIVVNPSASGEQQEISGVEDQGQDNTDTEADGVTPANGIAINMQLSVGDNDLGEALEENGSLVLNGEVTLATRDVAGDIGGTFYFNGTAITPDGDGNIVFDSTMFEAVDGSDPVTFNLVGITFVPDPDYSSYDDTDLIEFDVELEVNGHDPVFTSSPMQINIDGIADTPSITLIGDAADGVFEIQEDHNPFDPFNPEPFRLGDLVSTELQDTDGSESLRLEITLSPDVGELRGGRIVLEDGVWKLADPSLLSGVSFTPDENFSGDITVTVKAISTESDPAVVDTAETDTSFIIRVEPSADDARLTTRRVFGSEDAGNADPDIAESNTAIALGSAITLQSIDDTDGSEALFVRIFDIPDGAVLQLNDGTTITTLTDTDRVSIDDLDKLEIVPPVHSNENFTLQVEGIVVDSAVGSPDSERIISAESLEVVLTGVADVPVFDVNDPGTDAGQWAFDADTGVVSTSVPEDGLAGDGLVAVDFNLVSGENALSPSDTSESLSLIISNLPDGLSFVQVDGSGVETEVELTFAGWVTNADGESVQSYVIDHTGFADGNVYIKLPPNLTEDIKIDARLVATENDGDEAVLDTAIEIKIDTPQIDAEDYVESTSIGKEDEWIDVNWMPDLSISGIDDSNAQGAEEIVVGAVISGFDATDSVQLVKGTDVITLTPTGGTIVISEAQITDGYQLQVKRAENSDVDLTLNTVVTVRQADFEDPSITREKDIEGVVNVNIEAKVEEDGLLTFVDSDGNSTSNLSTASNGVIELKDAIRYDELDLTSDEVPIKVVITDLADGFYVTNSLYDGDGGWILNDPNDFSIVAPENSSGTTTFTMTALVVDEGDNNEEDVSLPVQVSSNTITLTYENTTDTGNIAQVIAVPTDPVVATGDEDNPISLQSLGEALNVNWPATGDTEFDQVSFIIKGEDLPVGAVVGGANYHVETDIYVFDPPGMQSSGNPYPDGFDLSELTITAPDDFAGELQIPISIVSVDSSSGNTSTSDVVVELHVNPLADVLPPTGAEQPSDNTIDYSFSLTVKETQGLDENQQPVTGTATEEVVPDEALEDGLVILSIAGSLADVDAVNGEETISNAELTVDASMGSFVLPDGSESTTVSLSGVDITNIKFKPAPDFSGEVSIDASLTITDTATIDGAQVSDSRDVTTSFTFDVTPVNDTVTITQDGVELADGEVIEVEGAEDGSGGISLASIGASFSDVDGSETLASVIVSNVPEGFTLNVPASNAGEGQWVIAAEDLSNLTNLSEIALVPPKDFSGTVDFVLTIYTKEAGLNFVVGESQDLTLTVTPEGDGATASVVAAASTVEDTAVTLEMEINALDANPSLSTTGQPAGVSFTENGPETILITVSGIPEGGKIILPDGVTGTVTPETSDGGDVVVAVDNTSLNDLTFLPPPDANGEFVLDLAIQTSDNGQVSADVVNKQVTVSVSAVNDAPVNIIADSYDAEEDTILTITDLQVSDVDVAEGTSIVAVELVVGAGNVLDLVGDTTGIDVTGQGTNTITLEGDIDAVNALLAAGVTYEFAGENTSGSDEIQMTTRDRGNFGTGGQKFDRDTVDIIVAPKADLPELTSAAQLASMRAATGALMPLLGLMASVVDPIADEFSVTFSGLGTVGQVVDSTGTPVGTDNGDGTWTFDQGTLAMTDLSTLNLMFSGQPAGDVTITALSDVDDGEPLSSTITVNVEVVDTSTDPVLNDTDNSNADLVIDGTANTTVYGGAADDILVGGLGEDILVGGAGDDELWGGERNGTGDGQKDTFAWESGDFGTAAAPATDTIKDFETGIDVIDISAAFAADGIFTFTELANRLDIQTVDGNTRIQVMDDTSSPIQNIIVEGKTLDTLLGMDATTLTQDEILESMLMAGQLVVFDSSATQFGTEADDTLVADPAGERIYAGDGDDTIEAGLGDDILVGGEGDDVYTWTTSSVSTTSNTDTVGDFELGDSVTGDKLDVSALLPDTVDSSSSIAELLDYIRPEMTDDGLTLHVSQTAGGTEVQDIVLHNVGFTELGLDSGATGTQILDELLQQQALKLD